MVISLEDGKASQLCMVRETGRGMSQQGALRMRCKMADGVLKTRQTVAHKALFVARISNIIYSGLIISTYKILVTVYTFIFCSACSRFLIEKFDETG